MATKAAAECPALVTGDAWGTNYAICVDHVDRIIPLVWVTPVPGSIDSMIGFIDLPDATLEIFDLATLLGATPQGEYPLDSTIIVLAHESRRTGFVVPGDVSTISDYAISGGARPEAGIEAVVRNRDRTSLVVDVPSLFERCHP